jgi:hypothetical protein
MQFLNFYGVESVFRLCFAAEWVGVCHFSWLLYGMASRIFCRSVRKMQKQLDANPSDTDRKLAMHKLEDSSVKPADANTSSSALQPPLSPTELNRGPEYDNGFPNNDGINLWDIVRNIWSTVATLGSVVILCFGISSGHYILPTPPAGQCVMYFTVQFLCTK